MSDSKLNNKLHGAVRTGGRRAAVGFKKVLQGMRIWQKIGLILCLVSWVVSAVIGAVCGRITAGMTDQNFAPRWAREFESAQISAFFADSAGASEETVKALQVGFMMDLQADAIGLSETQIENGASLLDACYCGMGSAEISTPDESLSVNAIGVGGDFFNFHPLDLIAGYYFSEDDLMQDRILLDDITAWRLFGSPYVVGQSVEIGGTPHLIAGVFRRPAGRFYRESGIGDYLIFMSYESLCQYTQVGSVSDDKDGSYDDSTDNMDAFLPDRLPAYIPATAAYMPAEPAGSAADPDMEAALTASSKPPRLSSLEEEDEVEDDSEEPEKDSDESDESDDEKDDSDDGDADDTPTEGMGNGASGSGSGKSGSGSGDSGESTERREVNRSRVTCYEVVLPEPVSGHAYRMVLSRIEQLGITSNQVSVIDNSKRYDTLRLVSLLAQPGVRSMQIAPIRYPYWENVALGWEDVLIPFALLRVILRIAPLLFLLFMVLWYATHKSWTVGGLVHKMQDKIYERQSERIYGKSSGSAAEALAFVSEDKGKTALPESGDPDKVPDSAEPDHFENSDSAGETDTAIENVLSEESTDSEETESEVTESAETDTEETESVETDLEETDIEETDSAGPIDENTSDEERSSEEDKAFS